MCIDALQNDQNPEFEKGKDEPPYDKVFDNSFRASRLDWGFEWCERC
jgi:hypothetical protein